MVTETKPLDPRAENQQERTRNLDELSAQLKQLEGVDDDIADLLANNWQRFVGLVALLLIAVWLYGGYRSTKEQRLAVASDRFQVIQAAYDKLPAGPVVPATAADTAASADGTKAAPEKITAETEAEKVEPQTGEKAGAVTAESEKQAAAVAQSFKKEAELLKSSDSGTAYAKLARLYEAAQSIRVADYAAAQKVLADFGVDTLPRTAAPPDPDQAPERFLGEMAAMLHARAKLAEDSSANMGTVREYLTGLATNAQFVNVEALILLGRIADTEELKLQVRVLAEKIAASRPELRETIQSELANIGLSLT